MARLAAWRHPLCHRQAINWTLFILLPEPGTQWEPQLLIITLLCRKYSNTEWKETPIPSNSRGTWIGLTQIQTIIRAQEWNNLGSTVFSGTWHWEWCKPDALEALSILPAKEEGYVRWGLCLLCHFPEGTFFSPKLCSLHRVQGQDCCCVD